MFTIVGGGLEKTLKCWSLKWNAGDFTTMLLPLFLALCILSMHPSMSGLISMNYEVSVRMEFVFGEPLNCCLY